MLDKKIKPTNRRIKTAKFWSPFIKRNIFDLDSNLVFALEITILIRLDSGSIFVDINTNLTSFICNIIVKANSSSIQCHGQESLR